MIIHWLKRFTIILLWMTALGTVLSFAARWHPWFELLTHFKWQYVLSSGLRMLLLLLLQQWRKSFLAMLLLALHLGGLWPALMAQAPMPIAHAPRLTVLHANVHSQNTQYQYLLEEVAQQQPDILFLQEVTPAWAQALEALKPRYPYHRVLPQEDNFGLAVFSRLPLRQVKIYDHDSMLLERSKHPENGGSLLTWLPNAQGFASLSMSLEVEFAGRWLSVLSVHPFPPVTPELAHMRNQQLQAAGEWAKAQTLPVFIVGDFNLSPWSPYYQDILRDTALLDAAQGHGVFITWPT